MAGPYYVRSTDGSDADSGLTWALAKATLAGALAVAAAGERIWVSDNHAETLASQMNLTSAGTAAAPVEILCGDDAAEPPTALATTATISTTGANALRFGAGTGYVYGITFQAGDAALQGDMVLCQSGNAWWTLDTCELSLRGTSSAARLTIGSATPTTALTIFINTNVRFSNASNQCMIPATPLIWRGGAALGSVITGGLIQGAGARPMNVHISGVDLSNLGAQALVLVSVTTHGGMVRFEHCKLGSSWTATTGAWPQLGQFKVAIDNCDSGDTQYLMRHASYEGDVYSETTIVRTAGASNGTTPLSHKMVSSASRTLYTPLYGPELVIWNNTTGSAKTATVEIVHDSVTALTDAEVWLEVEYLGTSGFPLSLFASDRKADVLATAADQTGSSVAWTTTGITNVNKQKLAVTFTPQEIGVVRARVALATSSYTVYVDPLLTVA